jgi:2-keto-4-pentenoate hydratase/2-oxohepta-3-ene-1,7-dioic acid hydratase in catechol pathway
VVFQGAIAKQEQSAILSDSSLSTVSKREYQKRAFTSVQAQSITRRKGLKPRLSCLYNQETPMDRRHFFQSSALVSTGALVGCVTPGMAQQQVKTPFSVPQVYVPIVGSDEMFPVRRIYCIGRNYAAHSREMGSDPTREPPFFFQKPTDAIQFVAAGTTPNHAYPPLTKNYHYEAELVAALNKGGRNIPVEKALELVYGYTLGLDMTRRDLQRAMGDEKKPWEIGKSFDQSAPIGAIHKVAQTGHFTQGAIWLKVNGQIKQNANLNQMLWSVAEQISKLSQAFELFPGDIIYSGTPENVGPVVRGDVIEMHIDGLPNLSVKIV